MANTHLLDYLEKKTNSYYSTIFKGFIYTLTRANWQYGFFSSAHYGYISYELKIIDNKGNCNKIIKNNENTNLLITKYNNIRLTSLWPSMLACDRVFTEASARSLALYIFNKYYESRIVELTICNNNMYVKRVNDNFVLNIIVDTSYSRYLYY